jgi:hypothetical protein
VPTSRQWFAIHRSRVSRRAIAFCLVVTYLLAGALHALYGLDVAHPSFDRPEIASLIGNADQPEQNPSEKKTTVIDDCHGCFSAVAPQMQIAVVSIAEVAAPAWPHCAEDVGITLDLDSPPPKNLT